MKTDVFTFNASFIRENLGKIFLFLLFLTAFLIPREALALSETLAQGLKSETPKIFGVEKPEGELYSIEVDRPWIQASCNGCVEYRGGNAIVTVSLFSQGLNVGVHSGSITIYKSWRDWAGAVHHISVVKTEPVNLTVVDNMTLSTQSISITVASGLYSAGNQFTISNPGPGAGTLRYEFTPTTSWYNYWSFVGGSNCSSVAAGQSCTGEINFYNPTLPPGTYTGKVTVKSGTVSKDLTVVVNIIDNMELSASSLSATTAQGLYKSYSFNIKNPGPGTGSVKYSITGAANWDNNSWSFTGSSGCGSVPAGGTCTGSAQFNSAVLSPGTYTGKITVSGGGVTKELPVTFTVVDNMEISPGSISAAVTPGCDTGAKTFTVKNPGPGNGAIRYYISGDKSWMSVGSSGCGSVSENGTCTGNISFNTSGLSQGSYTGTVTVTGGRVTETIPVNLSIKQNPAITYSKGNFTSCSVYEESFTITPNAECTTSYTVQFGTDSANLSNISTGTVTGANPVTIKKTFTDLSPGTDYYYRVIATNGSGTTTGETRQISKDSFPDGCTKCEDKDGDKYYALDPVNCPEGNDCDDSDASINPATIWYADADNDKYSSGESLQSCTQPQGYKNPSVLDATSGDCNDNDENINPKTDWYKDVDNDGYSDGVKAGPKCERPDGYKHSKELTATSGDCDDNNASKNPYDGDKDGYSTCAGDCNDQDDTIYPSAQEFCDTKDNNCSGETDEACVGSSCTSTPVGSTAHFGSGNLFHDQSISKGFAIYYNSLDGYTGPLGKGWTHTYNVNITEEFGTLSLMREDGKRVFFRLSEGIYYPEARSDEYSSIIKNADGTYTRIKKDGTVYSFNSSGKLASITDRNGNKTSLSYTGGGLSSITDSVGRKIELAYDAESRIIQVKTPDSKVTALSYDSNGYLAMVVDPAGNSWKYAYDFGKISTKTDPAGNSTVYVYDSAGRLISSTDASGKTKAISYDSELNIATVTERDGSVWTYKYDPLLDVNLEVKDPKGNTTKYTYNSNKNLISKTEADGSTTTYTYDVYGNMTSQTDTLGQRTSYTYNDYGQVTGVTDPQGNTILYYYDSNGNLISTTDASGASTQYQYDQRGNIVKITNSLGQSITLAYDDYNNIKSVTDPSGAATQFIYDINGNLLSSTDSNGAVTKFEYNDLNRLIKTTDPNGKATTYAYDALGNRTSETDANGNTTYFEYNHKGQVTRVKDALGNVTTYAYGEAGCPSCGGGVDKLTSLTDANGNATTFKYDSLGRLASEIDPLGNTTSYSYDAKGNLVSKKDGNGNTINYTYDAIGRLTKKDFPDGSVEEFKYDSKGNIVYAGNQHMAYNFAYDAKGKITALKDSNGREMGYRYDTLGNRVEMTTPEGKSIKYTYDQNNRLNKIASENLEFGFNYDSTGRRTSLSYPNDARAEYAYDAPGRLTSLTHKASSGSVIDSFAYTHDNIGNRLTKSESDKKTSYTYDAIYRLIKSLPTKLNGKDKDKDNKSENFAYDYVGNRLTGPEAKEEYSYNKSNQLTNDKEHQYEYDKNGNLVKKTEKEDDGKTKTWTYTYDYENRLVKVIKQEEKETKTVTFKYDSFGRRIEKKIEEQENGKIESKAYTYVYDNEDIIIEYLTKAEGDESKTEVTRYIHGPGIDEPLAIERKGEIYYYHADGLGSITALTDEKQKTIESYSYSSFGELKRKGDKVKNTYTYTAREWDEEIDLYYYRARYYDAEAGRFVSKDPIGFKGGVNIYSYAGQSPINRIDPLGLFGTADFVYHYYFGGGTAIDLGTVGLLNAFKNSASVSGATSSFENAARAAAVSKAKSLCDCGEGTKISTFNLSDTAITDVTNEPNLFAVGHSTFFRSATCSVSANCSNKTCAYSCTLGFSIKDKFKDPLSIGIETGGTIYDINASWSENITGSGSW